MTYSKESAEWLLIRANNAKWFSKEAMRYFGSRIYWNTLTPVEDGWLFISHEKDYLGIETRFSIRKVNQNFEIDTLEWQATPNFKIAKDILKRYAATEKAVA